MARNTSLPSEKEIKEAYYYFIGRLLVLRQEHIDFKTGGYEWNKLFHREVGKVSWANPNLDVAYSEAWIGIDKNSCAIVNMPEIKNRYYTFQVLNSWGETVSNINERNYPKHPFGKFAYCTKDSLVKLDNDIVKIPVAGQKFRVLARIELGDDKEEAIRLQNQMMLSMTGQPQIAKPADIPIFHNNTLIGAEGFVAANEILKSEPDINPGMATLQKKVLKVSSVIQNPENREKVDQILKQKIIPAFLKDSGKLANNRNGWMFPKNVGTYGKNYAERSYINLGGIWANTKNEATYFIGRIDNNGKILNGSTTYSITFPKNKLPQNQVRYFWSIVATDATEFHVIPNKLNKYIINKQTNLQANKDGSVTIVIAASLPAGIPESNWLPTKEGQNFSLTYRLYGLKDQNYFPPKLMVSEKFRQAQEE